MLSEYAWNEKYLIADVEDVLTPALIVYPQIVAANIACTLKLLDGKSDRWRVHIKTAKLGYTLRMLIGSGVRNFKCATTLELITACEAGADDVLLAYPVMGANARRTREIADSFRNVRISVLAEDGDQVEQWRGSRVGVFLDINPGMNRTGIEQGDTKRPASLLALINKARLHFRGLHYYDGQFGQLEAADRTAAAFRGYDGLMELVAEIRSNGFEVPEVVTAGTPTFPCSLAYEKFRESGFVHRLSPGTLVYSDATSLSQLPSAFGYEPAVVVMTRVVSRPTENIVTCDAGHKAVSADAGVPTCVAIGHPNLTPLSPSEEHLPMRVRNSPGPRVGETLYLIPRHVCPTVNNFNDALVVRSGRMESVEKVTARGREAPLVIHKNAQDFQYS